MLGEAEMLGEADASHRRGHAEMEGADLLQRRPSPSPSRRLSSSSSGEISFRSSVPADTDEMYRLVQSEYEEIPSFRWIASPLRWWGTRRTRERADLSVRSSPASSTASSSENLGTASGIFEVVEMVHFDGRPPYTTSRFEHLMTSTAVPLGEGPYGTVYRATLEDGRQVAVRRLPWTKHDWEFEEEVKMWRRLRHPNLLALRAYYFPPKGEKLLVFDYMPKGSLSAALRASRSGTPMDWRTRMDMAIGITRGLHHLHDHMHMVHGNLTGGNVLLDDCNAPLIADYGLRHRTRSGRRKLGYQAPELYNLKNATFSTDVYSLGVILLELFTGKSPTEAIDGLSLAEWVALTMEDNLGVEPFDRELMRYEAGAMPTGLWDTLNLALRCVDPSPLARPPAELVLHSLEEIHSKIHSNSDSCSSPSRC